jgi:hypothetical protein
VRRALGPQSDRRSPECDARGARVSECDARWARVSDPALSLTEGLPSATALGAGLRVRRALGAGLRPRPRSDRRSPECDAIQSKRMAESISLRRLSKESTERNGKKGSSRPKLNARRQVRVGKLYPCPLIRTSGRIVVATKRDHRWAVAMGECERRPEAI